MFGQNNHSDCTTPAIKHRDQNVLTRGCMSAKGVGEMKFTDGTISTSLYTNTEVVTPNLKKFGCR